MSERLGKEMKRERERGKERERDRDRESEADWLKGQIRKVRKEN